MREKAPKPERDKRRHKVVNDFAELKDILTSETVRSSADTQAEVAEERGAPRQAEAGSGVSGEIRALIDQWRTSEPLSRERLAASRSLLALVETLRKPSDLPHLERVLTGTHDTVPMGARSRAAEILKRLIAADHIADAELVRLASGDAVRSLDVRDTAAQKVIARITAGDITDTSILARSIASPRSDVSFAARDAVRKMTDGGIAEPVAGPAAEQRPSTGSGDSRPGDEQRSGIVIDGFIAQWQQTSPDTNERRMAGRRLLAAVAECTFPRDLAALEKVVRQPFRDMYTGARELAEEKLCLYMGRGEISNNDLLRFGTDRSISSIVVRQRAQDTLAARIQNGAISDIDFLRKVAESSGSARGVARDALDAMQKQSPSVLGQQPDRTQDHAAHMSSDAELHKARGKSDPLYDGIKNFLLQKGTDVSPSAIQRHFRIPPDRIHALLDAYERDGIVGPADPKNLRRKLMTQTPVDTAGSTSKPPEATPHESAPHQDIVPDVDESHVINYFRIGASRGETGPVSSKDDAQSIEPEVPASAPEQSELEKRIRVKEGLAAEFDQIGDDIGAADLRAEVQTLRAALSGSTEPVITDEERRAAESAAEVHTREAEKTPADIARENREAARVVAETFEDPELESQKFNYDPLRRLLERIKKENPSALPAGTNFDSFRCDVVNEERADGRITSVAVTNYHDLLRQRAALTDEFRNKYDPLTLTWNDGRRPWGKIAVVGEVQFWNALKDPTHPLHAYQADFQTLIENIQNEQLPDEYAAAVARGEVPTPVDLVVREAESLISTPLTGLTYVQLHVATSAMYRIERRARELKNRIPEEDATTRASLVNLIGRIRDKSNVIYGIRQAIIDRLAERKKSDPSLTDAQLSQEFGVTEDDIQRELTWRTAVLDPAIPNPTAGSSLPPPLEVISDPAQPAPETRKEWKEKLRHLVLRAEDREVASRRRDYLARRSAALDAGTELSLGARAAEQVRRIGEKYQQLRLPWKIAIGAGLATGAVAFASASAFASGAFATAFAAQRGLGTLSMYLNFERWGRRSGKRASPDSFSFTYLAVAAGLSLALGAASAEAATYASHTPTGQMVQEWLKSHWPGASHVSAAPERIAPSDTIAARAPTAASAADVAASRPPSASASEGAHAASTSQSARDPLLELRAKLEAKIGAPAPGPASLDGLPTIEARKGHGYEWMMKRLWEQMQSDTFTPPTHVPPGSDIEKLLSANAASIDRVVHAIASDPSHGFVTPDGASVKIDLSAKMTVGADGAIHLSDATHDDIVEAVPDMGTTAPTEEFEGPLNSPETTRILNSHGTQEGSGNLARVDAVQPASGAEASVSFDDAPHLYSAGPDQVVAYGGSEQALRTTIEQYLRSNPNSSVIGNDPTGKFRVEWTLEESKLVASAPLRTSGFMGLFSSTLPPFGPEDIAQNLG